MAMPRRNKLGLDAAETKALVDTSYNSFSLDDIAEIRQTVRKEFGNSAAIDADDLITGYIPTGISALDYLLGGGFPQGKMCEIVGKEGVGKSTMGLHMLGTVQKAGGLACIIDTEGGSGDKYRLEMFGVDPKKCIITMEDLAENAFRQIEKIANYIIQKQVTIPSLVILDSLAGLSTAVEQEAEIDANQVAITARMIKKGINRVKTMCREANLAVIFTNQAKVKIGGMVNPYTGPEYTAPGGDAPKYQSITRFFLERGKFLGDNHLPEGHIIRCKIIKCKTAPSLGRVLPIRFYYDNRAFCDSLTTYDMLCDSGAFGKSTWKTVTLPNGNVEKFQGESGFLKLYEQYPDHFINLMKSAFREYKNYSLFDPDLVKQSSGTKVLAETVETELVQTDEEN